MKFAARISSTFTSGSTRRALRRSLSAVGVFAAVGLFVVACSEQQLPTEVKTPSIRHNISPGEGPIIGTDRQDYALGETVNIEGWGWTPGETIILQVVHLNPEGDNSLPAHQPWEVVADSAGDVSASWLIDPEGDEGGATLKLTADGQTSLAHAEVVFTDLIGTIALYSDAAGATSQSAFPWGQVIRPRITGAQVGTCYRLRWFNPAGTLMQTTVSIAASSTLDHSTYTVPAVGPSGTWSVIGDQNTSGSCVSTFSSATNSVNFDVARAVVIGATDDQCVFTGSAPSGPGCASGTATTTWVRSWSLGAARTFVRFDLSAASPATIPAGVIVDSAWVRLTVAGTASSSRTYNIQRADTSWSEATVVWAGQPGVTGAVNTATMPTALLPGAGGGDPQTWVKWRVTADVQGYVSSSFTNHGWRISDAVENNSSAITGRFNTTEATCTGGTTCKRVMPVLLVDYSDPPHLAFLTTAFSGEVGQCLGPMRVQSQNFANAPLAVGSDLTVNLSTANLGTGGAGSFFSNASCTTGTTTTTIQTDSSNSNSFYYRATGRGDGTHDTKASATGYTPDASQTQTIDKATTTLIYTGDRIVLIGNTYNYSAVLTSAWEPCTELKRLIFRVLPDPIDTDPFLELTPDTTDTNGLAGKSAPTGDWQEGIYDGRTSFSGDANCEASKDDYAITLIAPGGAATGGGFLAGSKVGGGRANFGFTIRQIEGSDPIAYKGQFLMIKQEGGVPEFRCKGNITLYGSIPNTTPQQYAASGTCDIQLWDPALDGGNGDWYVPAGPGYTGQTFTFYFVDNGTGSKGKSTTPPDKFGFTIGYVGAGTDPSFALAELNGGNIDVKTGGTSAPTTDGGTTGGTGGRGKNK
jgi:hypothetical protein